MEREYPSWSYSYELYAKKRYVATTYWVPTGLVGESRLVIASRTPRAGTWRRCAVDIALFDDAFGDQLRRALHFLNKLHRPLPPPEYDVSFEDDVVSWCVSAKFSQNDVYERLTMPTKIWQCLERRVAEALHATLPIPKDCVAIVCQFVCDDRLYESVES